MIQKLRDIIKTAGVQGACTVESMQAALRLAECEHTSRGHVHALVAGRRDPTPDELPVVMDHIGSRGWLRAHAAVEGCRLDMDEGIVSFDREADARALAAIRHVVREAAEMCEDSHAALEDHEVDRAEAARLSAHADHLRRGAAVIDDLVARHQRHGNDAVNAGGRR